MSLTPHKHELFSPSGCLSPYALEHYLRGTLADAERERVKEHLDSCMLCRDALEGYELMDTVEISPVITGINRRLREKFGYGPGGKGRQGRMPALRQFIIPAAASLLVLFGIIAYFHFLFPDSRELAMLESPRPDEGLIAEPSAGKGIAGKGTAIDSIIATAEENVARTDRAPATSTTVGGITAPGGTGRELSPDTDKEQAVITARQDIDVLAVQEADVIDAEETVVAGKNIAGQHEEYVVAAKGREPAMASRSMDKAAKQGDMAFTGGGSVTRPPVFPGGADSLQAFLSRHISFTLSSDTLSTVFVKAGFTVSRKGRISDIAIIHSGGEARDREVLGAIKAMPPWLPAAQDGKAVSAGYVLFVYFTDH